MKFITPVLLASMLFLCSCSTPMPGTYRISEEAYKPAQPSQTEGTIYFFNRPSSVQAPCYILENDRRIGVIKSGTYFVHRIPAGQYVYVIDGNDVAKAPIVLTVEAGKTYYLEVRQESDFLAAHYYIDLSTVEKANAYLPTLKLIKWLPENN